MNQDTPCTSWLQCSGAELLHRSIRLLTRGARPWSSWAPGLLPVTTFNHAPSSLPFFTFYLTTPDLPYYISFRYADDTTLMEESEEELKSLLMKAETLLWLALPSGKHEVFRQRSRSLGIHTLFFYQCIFLHLLTWSPHCTLSSQ